MFAAVAWWFARGIYEYEIKGAGLRIHIRDQIIQRQMHVYLYLFIIPCVYTAKIKIYCEEQVYFGVLLYKS